MNRRVSLCTLCSVPTLTALLLQCIRRPLCILPLSWRNVKANSSSFAAFVLRRYQVNQRRRLIGLFREFILNSYVNTSHRLCMELVDNVQWLAWSNVSYGQSPSNDCIHICVPTQPTFIVALLGVTRVLHQRLQWLNQKKRNKGLYKRIPVGSDGSKAGPYSAFCSHTYGQNHVLALFGIVIDVILCR